MVGTKKIWETDAGKRANAKYKQEKMVQLSIRFGKEIDADILARLDEVPNKRQYIIRLIREDIAREQQK